MGGISLTPAQEGRLSTLRLHWTVSAALLSLSFALMVPVYSRFLRAWSRQHVIIQACVALLLPDVVMVLNFLPLEAMNLHADFFASRNYCVASAFTTVSSVLASNVGVIYLSYTTYAVLVKGQRKTNMLTLVGAQVAGWGMGLCLAGYYYSQNYVGVFLGLYCCTVQKESLDIVIPMFVAFATSSGAMMYFYGKTWAHIRGVQNRAASLKSRQQQQQQMQHQPIQQQQPSRLSRMVSQDTRFDTQALPEASAPDPTGGELVAIMPRSAPSPAVAIRRVLLAPLGSPERGGEVGAQDDAGAAANANVDAGTEAGEAQQQAEGVMVLDNVAAAVISPSLAANPVRAPSAAPVFELSPSPRASVALNRLPGGMGPAASGPSSAVTSMMLTSPTIAAATGASFPSSAAAPAVAPSAMAPPAKNLANAMLKRGLLLIGVYYLAWFFVSFNGALAIAGYTYDELWPEMVAAWCIKLSPIINALLIGDLMRRADKNKSRVGQRGAGAGAVAAAQRPGQGGMQQQAAWIRGGRTGAVAAGGDEDEGGGDSGEKATALHGGSVLSSLQVGGSTVGPLPDRRASTGMVMPGVPRHAVHRMSQGSAALSGAGPGGGSGTTTPRRLGTAHSSPYSAALRVGASPSLPGLTRTGQLPAMASLELAALSSLSSSLAVPGKAAIVAASAAPLLQQDSLPQPTPAAASSSGATSDVLTSVRTNALSNEKADATAASWMTPEEVVAASPGAGAVPEAELAADTTAAPAAASARTSSSSHVNLRVMPPRSSRDGNVAAELALHVGPTPVAEDEAEYAAASPLPPPS